MAGSDAISTHKSQKSGGCSVMEKTTETKLRAESAKADSHQAHSKLGK